mmetsp:Transcript_6674/g.10943  ORF Transcript_6674/g.10943 Transcript_6674/m.10943 type:complete len:629 (-) Transcript_6674:29-1915(-)
MGHLQEEADEHVMVADAVFGIVSLLIVATIGFEMVEEKFVHHASKNMKPFVSALFAELTVLGFLSLIVFVVGQAGVISEISEQMFHEEEELQELIEKVHYLLFSVMVLFMIEALLLFKVGNYTVSVWRRFNRDCQDADAITSWRQRYLYETPSVCYWPRELVSEPDRFFSFYSMRNEFIKARQPLAPFSSSPDGKLPDTFDYAEYLSMELGHFLSHLIHLPPIIWASLWIFMIIFYALYVYFSKNMINMAFIWIGFGLFNLALSLTVENKCHSTLRMLYNPADFPHHHKLHNVVGFISDARHFKPYEETPLKKPDSLPGWTKVIPAKPNWLVQLVSGAKVPNRQLALFWFNHQGPAFNTYLLRIHLLFTSIYLSLSLTVFLPAVVAEYGRGYGILYFFVSMASVYYEKNYVIEEMISTMCHISCSGLLKNSDAVDEVLRKQKSKRAVRAIMLMTSLNKKNQESSLFQDDASVKQKIRASDLPPAEFQEIAGVFDLYDRDGSGEIELSELGDVMSSLGFTLSESEREKMFATLDVDNDGSVSREEFLDWYANSTGGNKERNMRQMAQELFTVFDKDGSGSIDISELIQCLQGLNHGLTYEEIVQLAKELDENGDGEISMKEFEAIINED